MYRIIGLVKIATAHYVTTSYEADSFPDLCAIETIDVLEVYDTVTHTYLLTTD